MRCMYVPGMLCTKVGGIGWLLKDPVHRKPELKVNIFPGFELNVKHSGAMYCCQSVSNCGRREVAGEGGGGMWR